MKSPLTARTLATIKPPATGRLDLTDSDVPGLKFRMTQNGVSTWSLQVRIGGEKRRFTIGKYPTVGLSEARERARELRAEAKQGRDPIRQAREATRQAEIEVATRTTVADAIDLYSKLHLRPNLRTAAERERQLRAALGRHADRAIGDLTRIDLQRIIDTKAASTSAATANRIRAALIHLARWCWERGHIAEHVGAGTTRAGRETPRERVLALDEVRAIYRATFAVGPIWGAMFRVLILTGQRRSDITQMRWADLDFAARRYAIPGSRTKNRKAHIVHLSRPVVAELEALREITGSTLFPFTNDGERAVRGLHHINPKLYELSGVTDWRPHDFRTALASALCEAGESETVVDRILNHSATGSAPSAVARIYNRAQNLPQRAAALDRWAEMVTGERGVVVEMAGRAHE